jgi:hypothetical protein
MINVKSVLTRGLLVLACGTTAFTVNTLATSPAHAATAPASWTQRTCSAFATWQHKPTTGNLDALVLASLHLPRGYLAADVGQLYANAATAKPKATYISDAAQYLYEDCHNGYGL